MQNSSSEATTESLPRWDVSVIYPSLESSEFAAGFDSAIEQIKHLQDIFNAEDIRAEDAAPKMDASLVGRFERVIHAYNATQETLSVLIAYISSFVATDSRNTLAQARMSQLRSEIVVLGILGTRFTAWIGTLDVEMLIEQSLLARAHAHFLREARILASHLLPPGEEELSAKLSISGASAWGKLHGDITSQIMVRLGDSEHPMSIIRSLATSPDREIRRTAYEAELEAWERVAVPLSAAMNSIKHESNVLTARRGWPDVLDFGLFNNEIDRTTLEAMLGAARASFPDFRRYLRAKAKVVSGSQKLPWYDLFAPLGASETTWTWNEATSFVEQQFGKYSQKMSEFAAHAFREHWIDAEPRSGKRDGAFCMRLRGGESRILQNYKTSFGSVSTLAHELGHAYHNLCLADTSPLQRRTPMTLAETASIFCETVIKQAMLSSCPPNEALPVLEDSLQGTCQVVVDITSRFLFEQRVFDLRRKRELSVSELCGIMTEAQKETYGDGLDETALHPYMWAVKGHYYGSSFYNYPYMFGLLFGLGLYSEFEKDPETFRGRYDDLLSRTGSASAAELASDFGFDIRDSAFWTASLDIIRRDIDKFEMLTGTPA